MIKNSKQKKTIDGTRKYWKIYQSEDGEILYRLSNGKFFPQDIVDFITTILQEQKDEILAEVEKLKLDLKLIPTPVRYSRYLLLKLEEKSGGKTLTKNNN